MDYPIVIKCPCCGGPMKKDQRVEECSYCGSMIEWYKGPEVPSSPLEVRKQFSMVCSSTSIYIPRKVLLNGEW